MESGSIIFQTASKCAIISLLHPVCEQNIPITNIICKFLLLKSYVQSTDFCYLFDRITLLSFGSVLISYFLCPILSKGISKGWDCLLRPSLHTKGVEFFCHSNFFNMSLKIFSPAHNHEEDCRHVHQNSPLSHTIYEDNFIFYWIRITSKYVLLLT